MQVHRFRGLQVVIYPNDHPPPHVHVIRGRRVPEAEAKFEIAGRGVTLLWSDGFKGKEIDVVVAELDRPAVRRRLLREWRRIHGEP